MIRMRRIDRVIILLLAVLAVFTFVSRTVYNRSLMRVTAHVLDSGRVPMRFEALGALFHPGATMFTAKDGWRICQVFVAEGEHVEEGDLLAVFDTRLADIERMGLELEALRLENLLENLLADERDTAEVTAALEIARARLEFAVSFAPPEGGLFAPHCGIVYEVGHFAHGGLRDGDMILTLHPWETPQ